MTDKKVEKLLMTLILSVELIIVWADTRFHEKYKSAISILKNAIDEDYSKYMLFHVLTQFEIAMNKPVILQLKSGGQIIGNNSEEVIFPKNIRCHAGPETKKKL